MAGVNTMNFQDAAAILNNIRKQVTGVDGLVPMNTSQFVSVATTTLQAGYDPVLNAITQMVSRTIFSVRPYSRKFAGIKMDEQQWGSIVRKLAIADKDFNDDVRFDLVDGESIDMYKVNKPNVLQTNFYGQNVFEKNYTIFKDQLDNAFSGPQEFGRFMSMVVQNISDMIEQAHENIARMTIGNFIGAKIYADENVANVDDGVIHLLTEYNNETGSALTNKTVYAPANFPNFIKWMYARVATISSLMSERSIKYQINITDKAITRHTPKELQKIYLYAPLLKEMEARVLADTYNDSFLNYGDVEAVNFWQNINSPMDLKVAITCLLPDGSLYTEDEAGTYTDIVGVIFDRDALGYTTINEWSATTPLNAKGGYWNTFHHFTERWYNDFTEKGVVLKLD